MSHHYFKKHLGTSWLKEKEDISFIGIADFSLKKLKLLSMALELMLSVLAHSDALLANIPLIYYFIMPMCITKGYAETFLDLTKWLTKSKHLKNHALSLNHK